MSELRQAAPDLHVQCVRCRNRHMESERRAIPTGKGINELRCPRCGCKSFYDLRQQIAWCWSSGLVEVGDVDGAPEGSIFIARGPKAFLHGALAALCRHGQGASVGKLLVPGVPAADSQMAAADALAEWLKWCAKNNGHKGRHGVTFRTQKEE